MKRFLAMMLALVTLLTLCACGTENEKATGEKANTTKATEADIANLEGLYKDHSPYFGDMHNHSNSGGRSDGKVPLVNWPDLVMAPKDMDFAIIVDHKQTSHLRGEDWDDTLFIGGSELGTTMLDEHLTQGGMHYNLIFTDPDKLEELLQENTEYALREDTEKNPGYNTFKYAKFQISRFREIVAQVREKGGFYVMVHPLYNSYLKSSETLDYWMGDYTGFEVYTGTSHGFTMAYERNMDAYNMWVKMLNLGKIVFATCGSDNHRYSDVNTLSVIYSTEKKADAWLEKIRAGNFTAGPVGIRMAMGDVCTGGQTDFAGKRLTIAVGDFHSQAMKKDHTYRVEVYDENGKVFEETLSGTEMQYFAIDAKDCRYYRAIVYDVTEEYIFAVGNPIWNTKYLTQE